MSSSRDVEEYRRAVGYLLNALKELNGKRPHGALMFAKWSVQELEALCGKDD